jgi:hypothetical protein
VKQLSGGPRARFTAAFRPKRLGAPTTVAFAISIGQQTQTVPAPVSRIEVGYPETLGLATSGLGLAACAPAMLEAEQAQACPANSKIGQGSALVEVPFGPAVVRITVPPIVGIAGGPDVSLVRMSASIGGSLTYYEHIGGRMIAYQPRGIGLPDSCPRGGWRLAASFAFIDGTRSRAGTIVPCPSRRAAA